MRDVARAIINRDGRIQAVHEATCALQEMNGCEMTPEEWRTAVPVAGTTAGEALDYVASVWDRARNLGKYSADFRGYSLEFQMWRRDNMVLEKRVAVSKRFRALMKLTKEEHRLLEVSSDFLEAFTPDERKQLEGRPETDE